MSIDQHIACISRSAALLLAVLLAGCSGGGARSPEATIGPAATAVNEGDQHGADVEHGDDEEPLLSPGADPGDAETSQSDTDWGRIWDRLPDDFPLHPDGEPSDDRVVDDPVSGVYSVAGVAPDEMAPWMQAALEDATYSTEALSGPLDDGSFVLDSVGEPGCRLQIVMTPVDDGTVVTVRYGADCPND